MRDAVWHWERGREGSGKSQFTHHHSKRGGWRRVAVRAGRPSPSPLGRGKDSKVVADLLEPHDQVLILSVEGGLARHSVWVGAVSGVSPRSPPSRGPSLGLLIEVMWCRCGVRGVQVQVQGTGAVKITQCKVQVQKNTHGARCRVQCNTHVQ